MRIESLLAQATIEAFNPYVVGGVDLPAEVELDAAL